MRNAGTTLLKVALLGSLALGGCSLRSTHRQVIAHGIPFEFSGRSRQFDPLRSPGADALAALYKGAHPAGILGMVTLPLPPNTKGPTIAATLRTPIRRVVVEYYDSYRYTFEQIANFAATLLYDDDAHIARMPEWVEPVPNVIFVGRIELADGTHSRFEAAVGHAFFEDTYGAWWARHLSKSEFRHP